MTDAQPPNAKLVPLDEDDHLPLPVALDAIHAAIAVVIHRLVSKHPDDYPEVINPPDPKIEPTIKAMADLMEGIVKGKDIRKEMPVIERLIEKQDVRAEVLNKLSVTQDMLRLSKFTAAQQKLESVVLAVIDAGKLSPAEALAFLAYVSKEREGIRKTVQGSSVSGRDVQGLMDQMSLLVNNESAEFQRKLSATSPQNREIIRRLSHKLGKMAG